MCEIGNRESRQGGVGKNECREGGNLIEGVKGKIYKIIVRLDEMYGIGDSGSNKKTGRRAGVGRVVESDQEEQD